jgi:membrane protease YdiL (CAAX protease family)
LSLCGPLIGAVVATAVVGGRAGLRDLLRRMVRFRTGPTWWSIALGLPFAIAVLAYALAVAYSMFLLAPIDAPTREGFGMFVGFPITNAVVMWLLLVIVNGFGEETGWRGFLLPQLERRWSPFVASLAVGACWALWHVPAFFLNENYRGMPLAVIPMFFAGVLAGSVFLTWLYNRGDHSIALVAVWHGTFNFLTGTVAARGLLAPVETAVVMAIAAALLVAEVRVIRRGAHPSILAWQRRRLARFVKT